MRHSIKFSVCKLYEIIVIAIRFSWRHTSDVRGESLATVVWDIPADVTPGTYRIHHYGHHKTFNLFSKSKFCQLVTCSK